MKKPDFSAIKDRLKGLFSLRSKKGKESVEDFEESYYDDTDAEDLAEDVLSSEDYNDYEEDDEDLPPPQPMSIPKPEQDLPPDLPETQSYTESTPIEPGPLPGGTSPKELKLNLGQAKQTLREKLQERFQPKSSGLKLKLATLFKKSDAKAAGAPNLKALKDWWNKVGGQAIVEKLFKPEVRPLAHQTFLWLIFAVCAIQGAKMLALALTPDTQKARPNLAMGAGNTNKQADLDSIARNDVFGARGDVLEETLTPKKPVNENIVCVSSNQKSSLPLQLLSTVVLKDSVKSIASVQARGSRDFLDVREGDKVQNLAEVGKIDRLRMVVKNLSTGECEFIEGTDKTPPTRGVSPIKVVSPAAGNQIMRNQQDSGIKNEGNRFTIKKSLRDDLLTNNMTDVLTQARAVQLKRPDGTLAFKMTEIVPGSIYSKLNIQDGDVITGINGKSFNNLNEVMTLFSKVRDIDNFQISMERDGAEQVLEYNFE